MDVLQEVVGLELLLLDPALRADPAEVAELLHPDFVEYGASGTVGDRESVLAAPSDPAVAGPARDVHAVELGAGLVQVRYLLGSAETGVSLRSSLWVWDGATWRLWFHQATPTPGPTDRP